MATPIATNLNYGEILRNFYKEYSSSYNNPADLKRIHDKWKRIAAEC